MNIKGVIVEDFVNYKKPCMVVEFPTCSMKCNKECGAEVCHNSNIGIDPQFQVTAAAIVDLYIKNDITKALCCQGMEPFDSFDDLLSLIRSFRFYTTDDIVIYTGYTEEEIENNINVIKQYQNIIVKFGRYVPNQEPHFDDILGVNLASDNQYARRIS